MERRIVTVVPEQASWRVEFADHVPLAIADLLPAMAAACRLAREAHRANGYPTAVKVRMSCGDGMMIDYHG
jgi:hypothetical protein